jgi:protein phosphatase
MEIKIPKLSLVVLIGASGSGKSTFAKKHFLSTEILSSDRCRALVSDDENNLEATSDAFAVLDFIAGKRLAAGKLTLVDATNVQAEARKPLIELARQYHCLPVAIVFDLPESVCIARNKDRPDRNFGSRVILQHTNQLHRSLRNLKSEGFRHIFILNSIEEVDGVNITREPLYSDKTDCHGPFDIIGDIHGCYAELIELLAKLGYQPLEDKNQRLLDGPVYAHPEGRIAVFLGDLVDRGPQIIDTLKLVYNMVSHGSAFCVPGNHDMKLLRKLQGRDVQVNFGLAESLAQIEQLPDTERVQFKRVMLEFLDRLVSHYVLDDKKLVVVHAGLKAEMQGRGSGKVRDFCLYGETTGETDEFGLPERYNWATQYRGPAMVIYGHTPIPEPEWLNNTLNIDTGCVFGGRLTAFRYPEKEQVSVKAGKVYCEPLRPIQKEDAVAADLTAQQKNDDLLEAEDVLGKRFIDTRLRAKVTIREENAIAALEVMSRFAANPKWLIYLPPTMSPCETSRKVGYLEYPQEAFDHFRALGVLQVVCEKKHMGSRAVVVICRDDSVAARRFGVVGEGIGIIYTRTGRHFFEDKNLETAFLDRIRVALDKSDLWQEYQTDWACLDCELMPWSAKAQELLKTQYAAVGLTATVSLKESILQMQKTLQRPDLERGYSTRPETQSQEFDIEKMLTQFQERQELIQKYIAAYRRYCWKVNSIDDLKLAPFHLLATEGQLYVDRNHEWHMEALARICRMDDSLLLATPYQIVDVSNSESVNQGIQWWADSTGQGAEGMVIKPRDFISHGQKGLIQPALKCRGREYLRIIYGPEYTLEENLKRLRSRGLNAKRSLALREFALGIESLERFIHREPLRRVHECVFGILALESEPVDPRL